jgi:hypothetical protein
MQKRSVVSDCLLVVPWRIHLGFIYTTRLLSLYNPSNQLLSLYNSTSWLQILYLANFIYLNSSLISTWTLTWLDLQSLTLSWLNFFLSSVFKLNRILWSFSWLRLDLNQLKLLIFILLGLDLNWVLYLGIFLGLDSFRSPPSTWIDPFSLTWIQLHLLVESVLYKLDGPIYKKVSYPKQRSLLVLHVFVLPSLLTRVLPGRVTPYSISYPDAHLDFYLRLCPIPYPSRYLSHNWACYPDFYPRSCSIPYPNHYLEPYLSRYPSHTRACYLELYPITYLALPDAYPAR